MLTTIVAITLFALFCLIHFDSVGSPCAHLDTKVIKEKKNV